MFFNASSRNWAEVMAEGLWSSAIGGLVKTDSDLGQ